MSACPPQTRPTWPRRLLAITLVVWLAVAFTTALILIADHFDLPAAQAAGVVSKPDPSQTSVGEAALAPTADLSVTKRHQGNFVVGVNGVYSIVVRNVGAGPTIGPITVTDVLPAGLSFISFSGSRWTLAGQAGQVLTFTRSRALAAGVSNRIVVTVGVTNTAIGTVTNTVSVTTTGDLVPANNSTTDPTRVRAGVDLSIAKAESRDPITATDSLSYTLSVSNAGPSTAPSVGMTFVNASGAGWNCSLKGARVVCRRASLPVGAAPTIVITATAPADGGVITNTATVRSSGFEFVPDDNTASVTTTVTAVSDLSISKRDSPDPVYAGATLTYTLDITNAGPSLANNVAVTDTLPAGATYLGASGSGWSCSASGGDVICTRSSLAVGAAPPITLTVTAPGTTPLANSVTVGSDAIDLNPGNNTASAATTVNPTANLSISKTDTPDPVLTGAPLTYTLSVANSGPNATTSVMVTDTLPGSVTFVGVAAPGWSCGQSSGVVTCSLATLAVGAAPDIVITTNAPGAAGVFTNTASLSSALPDLTPANNATSITTMVAAALADLSISKSNDPDPVNIGSPLTYTLRISNTGPSPATTVRVTDTLPSGVAVTSIVDSGFWTCSQAGGVVTCTVPSLAVGVAPDIVIHTTAPVISGTIANIAAIGSSVIDPDLSDNMISAVTHVYSLADLAITQQESADPVAPNSTLTYTLSVTNAGPNTATPVRVIDNLPPSVTFVGASGSGWSCSPSSAVVTCTLASLVVGPAPDIVITVTTPTLAQTITNTATVASPLADLNLANNTWAETTSVTEFADVSISQTDGVDAVTAGGPVTYTITVTNGGPQAVVGATVADTFPAGLTGVTWTCAASGGSSCPASGNGDINATVNVTVGGAVTVTAYGTVSTSATGTLANTATVTVPSSVTDTNPGNNSATDADTIVGIPVTGGVLIYLPLVMK
ncbi:MAG: hypothetical protein HW418_1985 [Anaerolineales bacterium]|nr:hypothetical protein [Anaerolineales bacterium]